jgi:hypothetical protein
MNLYIHPDNQTLLWNTINKSIDFINHHATFSEKEVWFQSIIKQFYINNINNSNNKSLFDLNRETIKCMVDQLKNQTNSNQTTTRINEINDINDINTKIIENPDNKKHQQQQSFIELQQEYEKMLSKNAPKSIDFTEKIEDEPITNMNELLEIYKKERESRIINIIGEQEPNIINENPKKIEINITREELNELKNILIKLTEDVNYIKEVITKK